MKQYLPLALGLAILASPAFAAEDVTPAQSTSPAISQASPQAITPAETAPADTEQKEDAGEASTGEAAVREAAEGAEAKTNPAFQAPTDAGTAPAEEANPTSGAAPGEATNTEAKAAEAPADAPNVQKLFNIFPKNKQQAEADLEKKETPAGMPGHTQAPQQ